MDATGRVAYWPRRWNAARATPRRVRVARLLGVRFAAISRRISAAREEMARRRCEADSRRRRIRGDGIRRSSRHAPQREMGLAGAGLFRAREADDGPSG